jgi:hypothetical protein
MTGIPGMPPVTVVGKWCTPCAIAFATSNRHAAIAQDKTGNR